MDEHHINPRFNEYQLGEPRPGEYPGQLTVEVKLGDKSLGDAQVRRPADDADQLPLADENH